MASGWGLVLVTCSPTVPRNLFPCKERPHAIAEGAVCVITAETEAPAGCPVILPEVTAPPSAGGSWLAPASSWGCHGLEVFLTVLPKLFSKVLPA